MNQTISSLLARFRGLTPLRRGALMLLVFCAGILLISSMARIAKYPNKDDIRFFDRSVGLPLPPEPDARLKAEWQQMVNAQKESSPETELPARAAVGGTPEYYAPTAQHFVAQSAELAMATKEFMRARATMEVILERHHGYAAKLRMIGQPTGSSLTATLRVPSSEFGETVTDLKTLGTVEREEQTADEITQQHADLEAQLANARSRRQRLQEILAKDSQGSNMSEVQRQLSSVNAEIARLEAQKTAAEQRVTFANVLFSLQEEPAAAPAESMSAQLRGAAVSGLTDAVTSVSAILLFLIGRGPVLLIWGVILYFPGRWIWKKWRSSGTVQGQVVQGT